MLRNGPHRCRDGVTALPPPPSQQYDDGDGAAKQQSCRPGSHQGDSGTESARCRTCGSRKRLCPGHGTRR
jgi:hypothetical protein